MRSILAFALLATMALAGCTGDDDPKHVDTTNCTDANHDAYDAFEARNDTTEADLQDDDGDCVPNDVETELGTDPTNATSVPVGNAFEEYLENGGAQPAYEVYGPGSATVTSVGTPVGSVGNGGSALDWKVETGATVLFAEMRWNDPVQDVDLALRSPDAVDTGVTTYDINESHGMIGAPDSPTSITVSGPKAGAWSATAFANGIAANLNYEVVVTVFYGATAVPDGYTAFA